MVYALGTSAVSLAAAGQSRLDPAATFGKARIDSAVRAALLAQHINRAVIAIQSSGKLVYSLSWADPSQSAAPAPNLDTAFEVGSNFDEVTAVAMFNLAKSGAISLNEHIDRFFPTYRFGKDISIEELLRKTSGIPDEGVTKQATLQSDDKAIIGALNVKPLVFPPGTGWADTDSSRYLLSRIIELASGEPYATYIRRTVLEPVGITNVNSNDALALSALQILCWEKAVSGGQVVSAGDYVLMTTRPTLFDGTQPAYGMGEAIDRAAGRRRFWHEGHSSKASWFVAHYPDDALDVAILGSPGAADLEAVVAAIQNTVFRSESSTGQNTGTASEIYFHAIDVMHAIPLPPFIQYDELLTGTHKNKTVRASFREIERTGDGMTRAEGLRPDGSRSGDVKVYHDTISPAAFLGRGSETHNSGETIVPGMDLSPASPELIGAVRVSHYRIVRASDEDANGCQSSYHLLLSPTASPDLYNLRELWVDRSSGMVCRARLEAKVFVIVPIVVEVTEEIDPAGYVSAWSYHGIGKTPFGPYSIDVSAQNSDIRTDVAPLPANLLKP